MLSCTDGFMFQLGQLFASLMLTTIFIPRINFMDSFKDLLMELVINER